MMRQAGFFGLRLSDHLPDAPKRTGCSAERLTQTGAIDGLFNR